MYYFTLRPLKKQSRKSVEIIAIEPAFWWMAQIRFLLGAPPQNPPRTYLLQIPQSVGEGNTPPNFLTPLLWRLNSSGSANPGLYFLLRIRHCNCSFFAGMTVCGRGEWVNHDAIANSCPHVLSCITTGRGNVRQKTHWWPAIRFVADRPSSVERRLKEQPYQQVVYITDLEMRVKGHSRSFTVSYRCHTETLAQEFICAREWVVTRNQRTNQPRTTVNYISIGAVGHFQEVWVSDASERRQYTVHVYLTA